MNLTDLEPRDCRHTIVYGDGGTGKTTLAALLSQKYWLTWISCDGGHSVLKKLPREWQERINIIVLPDTVDIPIAGVTVKELFKYEPVRICQQHGRMNCGACSGGKGEFDTINLANFRQDEILVIDHLSRISDSIMAHVTKKARDRLLATDSMAYYKPQLDDYGSLGFNIGDLLKKIETSTVNIVAIAQSQECPMEVVGGKQTQLVPRVGSSEFGRNVANHFDNQIICSVELGKHKFGSTTTYSMYAKTKSRDDIAIEKMDTPSLIPFYDVALHQHVAAAVKLNSDINGSQQVAEGIKVIAAPEAVPLISSETVEVEVLSPSEIAKRKLAEIMARKGM